KKHVINRRHASKCGATVLRDSLKYFIGKHEASVKDHATTLIEMRMHQACAKTVAHWENLHGSFVIGQSLAADDGFGISNQVPMADHDEARNTGGTRCGHQRRQIRVLASGGRHHLFWPV